MKIDKTNPAHWLCLCLFGINVLVALVLRPLFHRQRHPRRVILYGHKLSGNLLALQRYIQAHAADEFTLTFLTMDKRYARQLLRDGMRVVIATRPEAIALLIRADVVISDHGLHVMRWLVGRSTLRFFDVWHGIPFKGFDADSFRAERRYDETWVASPLLKTLYVERYGFDADKVAVTGYARTDRLVCAPKAYGDIRDSLGLPRDRKIVLFAPTWKQESANRSLWPFDVDEEAFLTAMADVAWRTGCDVVIRSHLNSGAVAHADHPHVKWLPFAAFPDTEAVLLASDVLVCDWSSIAFDWLVLGRPAVFLDVPAPFAKGFSLGPEYRYGAVVANLSTLTAELARLLADPERYWQAHRMTHAAILERVYGGFADGRAAQRCLEQLRLRMQ